MMASPVALLSLPMSDTTSQITIMSREQTK
jgi:hypothetical protein